MKTSKLIGLSAALTALAPHFPIAAQALDPWDSIQDIPGLYMVRSSGRAAGVDPVSGAVFTLGTVALNTDGTAAAAIHRTQDGGATWTTNLLWQNGKQCSFNAFAGDPSSGLLYAGGYAGNEWIVYRSDDGGDNWYPDHVPFQYAPGKTANCRGLAADGQGRVYAVGYADGNPTKKSQSSGFWVVRKRNADGIWSTVDAQSGASSPAGPFAVAVHSDGGVFVVGELNAAWTVRYLSPTPGASWTPVDTYQPNKAQARAQAIAIDSNGAIYVAGFAGGPYVKGRSASHWVVRRSATGAPGTWNDVDWSLPYAAACGIVMVPRPGNLPDEIFVTGRAVMEGALHWLVRRAVADAALTPDNGWRFSDDYLYPGGVEASANAVTSDAQGDIYTIGSAFDGGDVSHWITRKLAVP